MAIEYQCTHAVNALELLCVVTCASALPPSPPLFHTRTHSLCIIYGMVALANWVSVSIVAVVGPKYSLIVSGFLYV